MSPYAGDYPRYGWQLVNGFRARHEQGFARLRHADTAAYLDYSRPLRILDLANGRLRPQYTLLQAGGHHVYGVDWVNRPRRSAIDRAYTGARWLYQRQLGRVSTDVRSDTLACGDVRRLPYGSASFDLATSVAAFEHFLDVPAVVAELWRVLRPGGMAWVSIHLFTSPSGGHNLSFTQIPLRTIPPGVDPWDHLRRRRLPFTVPLNEWRMAQYHNEFARHFEIIKSYCALREGEQWLTPTICAELAAYSRDELTCAGLVIVARKRS